MNGRNVIIALALLWTIARFVALDSVPGGFHPDEASDTMHLICMSEHLEDANGTHLPFFATQFEPGEKSMTGMVSPIYLYFGAAWVKIFGHSVVSSRGISAFFILLASSLTFFVARPVLGFDAALVALLSAMLSPWLFQLGRLTGFAGQAVGLVALGSMLLLRAKGTFSAIAAALILAAAMYAYSPQQIQVPLIVVGILIYLKRKGTLERGVLLGFFFTFAIALIPLLWHLTHAQAMVRFNYVSIFAPSHLIELAQKGYLPWQLALSFMENLLSHFSPRFLFISGDSNLLHSTQSFGELSWLDATLVFIGLCYGVSAFFKKRSNVSETKNTQAAQVRDFLVLTMFCTLAGIIPAALTFRNIPHALRASGAAFFAPLAIASTWWWLREKSEFLKNGIVPLAAVYTIFFGLTYFWIYAQESNWQWLSEVQNTAKQAKLDGNWQKFGSLVHASGTPEITARFYLVEYGAADCHSSLTWLHALTPKL